MTEVSDGKHRFYALLIGIDHYLEHRLPGGIYYPKLNGCVPDIERVEGFLKDKVEPDEILKLTATNVIAPEPPEPNETWPTYENMVQAFKEVLTKAKAGDQVYVHYAGHGGRSPTIYPEKKGEGAMDESLVPMDIGREDGRYLRDLELAHIFKTMVDKGIFLTVALDSCHSGGTTRNPKVRVRGLLGVDTTARPTNSDVASGEELAATWDSMTRGRTRAFKPQGDWLPHPEGYTLLAACEPQEFAHETELEDGTHGGLFTYWLIDSLQQLGPGLSYRMVHNRILPKVHGKIVQQTPMLQGEGDRTVFGVTKSPEVQTVSVIAVDVPSKRVELDTGQAQVVTKGAVFAIYPQGTVDFTEAEKRLARVKISKLGAVSSWAEIVPGSENGEIIVGDRAVQLNPGKVRLMRKVCLLRRPAKELPGDADQESALVRVKAALEGEATGWIEQVAEGEDTDYLVDLSDDGTYYRILDMSGEPIPNIRPALRVDDESAAARVVQRLVHITKYTNLLELENSDSTSPLAHALDVELLEPPADWEPGEPLEGKPFEAPGNRLVVSAGQPVFVRVKNQSTHKINLTVLNMSPEWDVQQVHPRGMAYLPLDGGGEETFGLHAALPEGYGEGTDMLKVFATLGPADYGWTELPKLDEGNTRSRAMTRSPEEGDALNQILAAFTAEKPTETRSLDPVEYASQGWTTTQVEVHVKSA